MAHILSLATAVPPNVLPQSQVLPILSDALGREPPERLAQILGNTGIEQRHLARPPQYYFAPRAQADRAHVYTEVAQSLFAESAHSALQKAGRGPEDIGGIVWVSTTGTLTPSVPSRALETMGFAPGTPTLPVFGWGCAGGGLGLDLAARMADGGGDKPWLLVCAELCSLAYDHARMDKKDMVALALFADGAAAAVIAPGDGPNALGDFARHTWPQTIDMMGWEVGDTGFDLVLARDIPRFVQTGFAPFANDWLAGQGIAHADLAEPACHPGGGRVVDALAEWFGQGLPATREVLRTYGNMSSPTVLTVLERVLASEPDGPVVVTALGPGFTGVIGRIDP